MKHALAKLELLKSEFANTATTEGSAPNGEAGPKGASAVRSVAGSANFDRAIRLIKVGLLVILGFFGFIGG